MACDGLDTLLQALYLSVSTVFEMASYLHYVFLVVPC